MQSIIYRGLCNLLDPTTAQWDYALDSLYSSLKADKDLSLAIVNHPHHRVREHMAQQAAEEDNHPVHGESWTWMCSVHQQKVEKLFV